MKNFIPINRRMFENYIWKEKRKFSKFESWLDLLQLVSFTDDNKSLINGLTCTWGRGQFPISISFLANRWGWTEKPVRNWLKVLEKDSMIFLKKESKWTMLTICKYEDYNKFSRSGVRSEGNQEAIKGQQLNNIKNINKLNKEKLPIFLKWFEYRNGIKKSIINDKTIEALIEKFNTEPIEKINTVVNASIENQWQGLFWDKYNHIQSNSDKPMEILVDGFVRKVAFYKEDGKPVFEGTSKPSLEEVKSWK